MSCKLFEIRRLIFHVGDPTIVHKNPGKNCGQYFIFVVASDAASSTVFFHAARSLKLLRMMLPHTRVGNFGVKKIFVAQRHLRLFFNKKIYNMKICNTNIFRFTVPPKTDSEDNADACRPLSLRHRRWIQRSSTIAALLRIVLAFLVSVKQRRGPKMRPHSVQQQSQITTPTGIIPNTYNGYLRIPDPQLRSRIILMILMLLLPSCY